MTPGTATEIVGEGDDKTIGLRLTYHPPLVHFRCATTDRACTASAQIDTRRGPVTVTATVPREFGLEVAQGFRTLIAALRGLPIHHPRVARDLQTAATMLDRSAPDAASGGFFGDLVAGVTGTLAGIATSLVPGVGPLAAPVVGAAVGKLVKGTTEKLTSSPARAPAQKQARRPQAHKMAKREALRQRLASLPPAKQATALRIREASGYAVRRLGAKIAAAHALAEMKRQAITLAKDPQIARAVGLTTIVVPGPGSAAVALRRAVRLQALVKSGDPKAIKALGRLRKQALAGHDPSRRALWILDVVARAPKL